MKIRGRLTPAGVDVASLPFIRTIVELPNGDRAPVDFLVDTGADETVIHPLDYIKLRIGILPLNEPGKEINKVSNGIGGSAEYNPRCAKIRFRSGKQTYDWDTKVGFGPCGDTQFTEALKVELTSVLGRDFLRRGRLVVDDLKDQIFLELHPDNELERKRDLERMKAFAKGRKQGARTT